MYMIWSESSFSDRTSVLEVVKFFVYFRHISVRLAKLFLHARQLLGYRFNLVTDFGIRPVMVLLHVYDVLFLRTFILIPIVEEVQPLTVQDQFILDLHVS